MHATWYFDFISPFAYLQWPRVKALSQRVDFTWRPILFAGVLDRLQTRGPAEIPGKREFTYRFVRWRAERAGIALRFPPAHPFNPMAALRLCIAAGTTPAAIDAIYDWIWRDGHAGDSAQALAPVAKTLGIDDIDAAVSTPQVKADLRANFDAAVAAGVFGVPTIVTDDGQHFWGEDATGMFEDWLDDPQRFRGGEYERLAALPVGVQRQS